MAEKFPDLSNLSTESLGNRRRGSLGLFLLQYLDEGFTIRLLNGNDVETLEELCVVEFMMLLDVFPDVEDCRFGVWSIPACSSSRESSSVSVSC